jgi:hypothetical protein
MNEVIELQKDIINNRRDRASQNKNSEQKKFSFNGGEEKELHMIKSE